MAENIRASFKPTLDATKRKLDKAHKKLSHLEIANKKCAIVLDQWVLQNFKTEGGKVGGWPPFKYGGRINDKGLGTPVVVAVPWGVMDAYVDESAKLLQDTGTLRRSFKPWSNKLTAGIGSDLPYSKPHEKGTSKLPQRRMLPRNTDRELTDKIYAVYETHVKTSLET